MKYTTCVVIPCSTPAGTLDDLKLTLRRSRYAELRLDFMDPDSVEETISKCKRYLKRTVCTLRPKTEGGRFAASERKRVSLLRSIYEYGPHFLDIEYNTLHRRRGMIDGFENEKILVSWHDFAKTPGAALLARKFQKMREYSPNVKIVTTAAGPDDLPKVLALYGIRKDANLVAFCMGNIGRISRLVSLYLGAPFMYASMGKPVAPGQYSMDEIDALALRNSRKHSKSILD